MCRIHPNGEALDAAGDCLGCALEAERDPKNVEIWRQLNPYWRSVRTPRLKVERGPTDEAVAAVRSFYWEPEERDRVYVPAELRVEKLKVRLEAAV